MKGTTINPALKFIQTAGVAGFVSGVRGNIIPITQAFTVIKALGTAIDTYVEAEPQDTTLIDLRRHIGGLPAQGNIAAEAQDKILVMLTEHKDNVELAVRMAIKINAVGQVAVTGAAAAQNLEVPFDLGAEMRWIPPGEFQMGSRNDDPHAHDDEKPLRIDVTSGFFMLDHPVTNAEFKAFLKATGREDERGLMSGFAGNDQPAVCITHEEATAYSKWLGEEVSKRMGVSVIGKLPVEADWEKAAKGPSGDEFVIPATPAKAHFDAEATRSVNHPAAYANGYGLRDMIGNVYELTSSPRETSSIYAVRGAAWGFHPPSSLRAAFSNNARAEGRCHDVGFRPILVPQDSEG